MKLDMAFLSKGAILPWAGGCGCQAQQSPNKRLAFRMGWEGGVWGGLVWPLTHGNIMRGWLYE